MCFCDMGFVIFGVTCFFRLFFSFILSFFRLFIIQGSFFLGEKARFMNFDCPVYFFFFIPPSFFSDHLFVLSCSFYCLIFVGLIFLLFRWFLTTRFAGFLSILIFFCIGVARKWDKEVSTGRSNALRRAKLFLLERKSHIKISKAFHILFDLSRFSPVFHLIKLYLLGNRA